ncbi:MAG: copper homeostasis protein CutC [Flavobacteriaceae bacterium]|nr:copper homeostasis protein CutC [Flavobacteriaceae bacterium]|tara:strand:- start:84 stop:800 length:717 start_codon:yes stop_codon:yes gene_type:complete
MTLEVCAHSFESALAAQKAGAHRIELCNELSLGGITPSYGLLEKVMSELTIPVFVLIRPRSGNFAYSPAEVTIMLKDIALCKEMGVQGIVCGALTEDHHIDEIITQALVEASRGMEFTFHRAFDWSRDPMASLKTLENLGIKRILTSGQQATALEGFRLLKELQALSNNLIIVPGGGISAANVREFKDAGFLEVHASASEKRQTLESPPKIPMQSVWEEGVVSHSSEEKIRELLQKLA